MFTNKHKQTNKKQVLGCSRHNPKKVGNSYKGGQNNEENRRSN